MSKAIGGLKRVTPYVSVKTALQIYQALIQLHLDYSRHVLDECNNILCDKLQKLQNRAAIYGYHQK